MSCQPHQNRSASVARVGPGRRGLGVLVLAAEPLHGYASRPVTTDSSRSMPAGSVYWPAAPTPWPSRSRSTGFEVGAHRRRPAAPARGPRRRPCAAAPCRTERLGVLVDRRLQRGREPVALDDPADLLAHPLRTGPPRRAARRAAGTRCRRAGDLLAVDGLDQRAAAREVAVERAGADPRPLGDVVERRVDAVLDEHVPCRGHDPLVVAPRVGPHTPPLPSGEILRILLRIRRCSPYASRVKLESFSA